ncbi:hypothetical protein [Vibrio pectenicida]|uniref:Uncharacterized protein n=1 Tax=Vibrio pectenicida TaxID=62763 RepID=A0A427U5K5_9VIBR|nr:hypothetical protein [Vibrio pectenicida]RSD31965.1 hypothetical protein EJA03_06255 [Vibrio pectenicida]
MSELEHANAVLAEAREVLKKSEENYNKSLKLHDLSLVQHRELAYALSCLVHPSNTMEPLSDDEIEQLKQSLKNIPSMPFEFIPKEPVFANGRIIGLVDSSHERIEHREVYDIVNAINTLAIANTDVIHVFTEFYPHIEEFCVNVYGVYQDYIANPSIKPLIQELVFLADNEALEKLLSIESLLTDLIIEAREEAEAKAEVEA